MLFKIANTIRRALQDAAEKRAPHIRKINGKPYAYCRVRRAWVPVRFKGE